MFLSLVAGWPRASRTPPRKAPPHWVLEVLTMFLLDSPGDLITRRLLLSQAQVSFLTNLALTRHCLRSFIPVVVLCSGPVRASQACLWTYDTSLGEAFKPLVCVVDEYPVLVSCFSLFHGWGNSCNGRRCFSVKQEIKMH